MSMVRIHPFPAAPGFVLCLRRILITSSSAKTLAEPHSIVQEGEQAQVETGQSVIAGVDATETANGSTQFQNAVRTRD